MPPTGPLVGGNIVTLYGENLGANDLVNVTLCDLEVSAVTWISNTRVEVVAKPATANSTGNATLLSVSYGLTTLQSAYTYNPSTFVVLRTGFSRKHVGMMLYSVIPNNGSLAGGDSVTIVGSDLGVNDTLAVTLNGIAVSRWWWLTNTMIIVQSAPGGVSGTGAVVVNSTSYGSVAGLRYTYNQGEIYH